MTGNDHESEGFRLAFQPQANGVAYDRPVEVLNFEDNANDALLVQRALQNVFLMKFQVTTVQNLADGLDFLRTRTFDVGLLDLNLPDAFGLETFERLRTEAPQLPLIVLTGNDDDALAGHILRQGAQDYLLKHEVSGTLLAKAIRYAIERHRVRVELNAHAEELAESEAVSRRARNRYFALFDRAPIGCIVFDKAHSIKEVNHAAAGVFGANRVGGWDACFYGCLSTSARRVLREHLDRTLAGEAKQVAMIPIRCEKGGQRELHFESHLLQTEAEGGAQCLSTFVDFTAQRRAEVRSAKALKEKIVLLKEIHHRVKNNLQIISSLLNLQSRRISDPKALEIFRESCDRIQLMALIHEKLYAESDLAELDFNDYLHSLAAMIARSYASQSRHVRIVFALHERLHLSLDTAIPLGLVASELISNSLKHAFSGEAKGTITLELSRTSPSACLFRVSDDGKGLPEDFAMTQPTSLGLRLVKLLTEQLAAQLTWSRSPGASFTLEFQTRTKPTKPKNEPAFA